MDTAEKTRFDRLYRRHLRALKLQGMSDKTIDVYARAVRRSHTTTIAVPTDSPPSNCKSTSPACSSLILGAPSRSIVTAYNSSGNTSSNATGSGLRLSKRLKYARYRIFSLSPKSSN